MSETSNESYDGTINRRAFLKKSKGVLQGVGAMALLAGAEAYFGPFNNLLDYFGRYEEKGGKYQRAAIFEKLLRNAAIDPKSNNLEVLSAWLKFNAVELRGNQGELPLSSEMVRHYLYGKGEELDISTGYRRAILQQLETDRKKFPWVERVPAQVNREDWLLARYHEYYVLEAMRILGPLGRTKTSGIQFNTTQAEFELNLDNRTPTQTSLVITGRENTDFKTALGDYTIRINGLTDGFRRVNSRADLTPRDVDYDSANTTGANEVGLHRRLQLAEPVITVYDSYDFDPPMPPMFGFNPSMWMLADFIGQAVLGKDKSSKLLAALPKETQAYLRGVEFTTFNHYIEGPLLEKHGFATQYLVKGNIPLGNEVFSLPIYIDRIFFKENS